MSLIYGVHAVQIVILCIFGAVCAIIAHSRGRSAVGWFFIGFFFHCLGLIVLLVIPDLKKQEEERRRFQREQKRLGEQMRLDRQTADRRHEDVSGRLGSHDRALGLDTAPANNPAISGPTAPPPLSSAFPQTNFANFQWYYADSGTQKGPVPFEEFKALWRQGQLKSDTLVWYPALKDWSGIQGVTGLVEALNG